MSECGICAVASEDCVDGLCSSCEPEFMKSLHHCARIMPDDTTIEHLFAAATNITKARLQIEKN
jgi:hypothetical protein